MFRPVIRQPSSETNNKYLKEGNVRWKKPLSYTNKYNFLYKWHICYPVKQRHVPG